MQGGVMSTDLIERLLAKPIAFHRIFATIGGGVSEGVFLSQAYYWSFRTTIDDEWFYKTQQEWCEETALNRREQEAARKRLIKLGILEEKKQGMPSQLYYRVNRSVLYELIRTEAGNPRGCKIVQNDNLDTESMDKSTNLPVQKDIQSIYTENTSETTSPLTPQGERGSERNFGFEIPLETSNAKFPASVEEKIQVSHEVTNAFVGAIAPPPILTDKFFTGKTRDQLKYEKWAETAHPALVYGCEDTPWLESPTRTEFVKFNQSFLDWHIDRCME